MKQCPKCKTMLEDDELFCHECGMRQEIEESVVQNVETETTLGKKCIHCGETIETDSVFCPFCGKSQTVESVKEAEPEVLVEEPVQDKVPVQEEPEELPTYIEEEERSKTWIYVLLAVLIGGAIWYFFINDSEKSSSNDNPNPVEIKDNASEDVTDNTPVEKEEKVEASTPLAFLEQFYKGLEESSYDSDYVRKYITFRAEKYLRDRYDYDCDGDCLATWLFAYEAGSDTGGLRERIIEMIDENTYQVVNIYELEGFEGYTAYEYIVLLGIVKEGNSYKIDTIKVTSSRPIIG